MKIKQDFILLILNCNKYKHKAIKQKNTWLKNIPENLIYFHIIGNEDLNKDFEFNDIENILYVKTKDDYIHLPEKIIMAYHAINCIYDFLYIFKSDDDQKLIYDKFFHILINYLNIHSTKINYGGFTVNIRRDTISQQNLIHNEIPPNLILYKTIYCSGRFYFLSSKALNNILLKKDKIKKEYFEDYAIGFYLDDMYKIDMYSLEHYKFLIDDI
jgi:hypothetical protein